MILRISLLCLVYVLAVPLVLAASMSFKPSLSWSAPPLREVSTAAFTSSPNEMLVVTKGYEPDGAEAESLSEAELAAIQKESQLNPRIADPTVQVLKLAPAHTDTIDFGWNPVANGSRSVVYYAFQKKPISGLRVLANTQNGNEIKEWNRATKAVRVLASPTVGYYDDPLLSPNGKLLAYSKNDATNGEWGGQVGVGVIDLATGKEVASLNPKKHHNLFDLVNNMFWTNANQLYAVRRVAKSGGTYLADEYSTQVVNVSNPASKPDPQIASRMLSKKKLQESLGEGLQWVSISPDQLHAAAVTDEDQLKFIQVKPRQSKLLKLGGIPRSAVWSADSTRCAVILSVYKDGRFQHDDVRLFEFGTTK